MAKRRANGEGNIRKRDDGRWEGRIVVGHKENGAPIFRYVYGRTQKELLDKLHQNIRAYDGAELTEESNLMARTMARRIRARHLAARYSAGVQKLRGKLHQSRPREEESLSNHHRGYTKALPEAEDDGAHP